MTTKISMLAIDLAKGSLQVDTRKNLPVECAPRTGEISVRRLRWPGDVVIVDNLGSHRGVAVREVST